MALGSLHADERVALCVGQPAVNLHLEKLDVPRDRVHTSGARASSMVSRPPRILRLTSNPLSAAVARVSRMSPRRFGSRHRRAQSAVPAAAALGNCLSAEASERTRATQTSWNRDWIIDW